MAVNLTGKQVMDLLAERGYDFFTGVPCSLFGDMFEVLEESGQLYVRAPREDVAMAVACGAALARKKPAVLMQNSGLGLILNALFSLNEMYRTHALIMTTWRGKGPDAPEHVSMGERLPALLRAAQVPWVRLAEIGSAPAGFFALPSPVCVVVEPGDLA